MLSYAITSKRAPVADGAVNKLEQMTMAVQAVGQIRRLMGFKDRGLEQDRIDVTSAYGRVQRWVKNQGGPAFVYDRDTIVMGVTVDLVPEDAPSTMRIKGNGNGGRRKAPQPREAIQW